MPDLLDYTRVAEGHVTAEYAAAGSLGEPGAFQSAGCVKGNLTVNDTVEERADDITNWCTLTSQVAQLNSATGGDRDVTISFTLEMVLSDDAYAAMLADYRSRTEGYFRVTATDGNAPTPTTQIEEYRVLITQFTRNYNQEGTSDIAVVMRVNAELPSGGW